MGSPWSRRRKAAAGRDRRRRHHAPPHGIDASFSCGRAGSGAVVFLTMHRDATFARRALDAGASGFVLKHSAPAELVTAIRAALAGKTTSHRSSPGRPGRNEAGPGAFRRPDRFLTPRQREVLQLLAEGRSTKEIASRLRSRRGRWSSTSTRRWRRWLHTNAELIHFAIKHASSSSDRDLPSVRTRGFPAPTPVDSEVTAAGPSNMT